MKHGGASVPASRSLTAPLRAACAFDAALALVLDQKRMDRECRTLILRGTPDERLFGLCARLNSLGGDVENIVSCETAEDRELPEQNLRFTLANLAAYALIWATTGQMNFVRGCKAIAAERQRQGHLLVLGDIKEDVASPTTDPRAKFRVLFEECGEVAHAIDQVLHHGLAASNIHTELTQVAAVCVAWLESFAVSLKGAKAAKEKP